VTYLRRVEADDVEFLDTELADVNVAGEYAWFGFKDDGTLRRRVKKGKTLTADRGLLAVIDDDGVVVGTLSWLKVFNGPPPNGDCWNMGIWIHPDHRRKGHASEAQRLGAAYLFDHTLMERVEAGTETGNVHEQRALERAGFTREGVLRHACFRGGQWRDMVIFSKLRGE
jgi:RimJ/RimL family protein N-acetyltransferase